MSNITSTETDARLSVVTPEGIGNYSSRTKMQPGIPVRRPMNKTIYSSTDDINNMNYSVYRPTQIVPVPGNMATNVVYMVFWVTLVAGALAMVF
jgi:hypothetical protein